MKNNLKFPILLIFFLLLNFPVYGNQNEQLLKNTKSNIAQKTFTNKKRLQNIGLVFSVLLGQNFAAANCNVCRNGGEIIDPNREFTMPHSDGTTSTWTCGFLQESMADVLATGGAPGEARWCALGQLWADKECACSGDPVPTDPPKDPNPSCNLCKNLPNQDAYDFSLVPSDLEDELVETDFFGRVSCGGLQLALAEGVIAGELCPRLQEKLGKVCCNAPALDFENEEDDSCGVLHANCATQACCSGFICKSRFLGRDPICSSKPRERERIGLGSGGAAGRQRTQGKS